MNCNPFTNGHLYLIQKALEQVDFLYIFVVEEDRSFFRFSDRFKMVCIGTESISRIKVIPSGKYIISQNTFSTYFTKDIDSGCVIDCAKDVSIFGEVIAPKLSISKRFLGEEPNDIVTRKYNEALLTELPKWGIDVIVFPRLEVNHNPVSATDVRKLYNDERWDVLQGFVPEGVLYELKRIKSYNKNS